MQAVSSRPFEGRADLDRLVDFARDRLGAPGRRASYWHPGDISWQLYSLEGLGPVGDVRLWADSSGLAAFATFEAPLRLQYDLRPGEREDGPLAAEVVGWARSRRERLAARGPISLPRAYEMLGGDTVATMVLESDGERRRALERLGFAPANRADIFYARSLESEIPPSILPPGFRLRHATDADAEERADLHADAWSVWGPSSMTAARHRQLRAAPLYREDLDVVAESPDGRLVSYCVCWADEATGVACFEPVGTRPSFTGLGLSRAVIHEALRRLRALGIHTATVSTAGVNEAAQRVYPSCGFEEIDRGLFYVLRLSAGR